VKRTLWLLPVLFIICTLAACNRPQARIKPVVGYEKSEDTETVVLENSYLQLRFLPETAGIILVDKSSGREWHSTPADALSDRTATVVVMDSMKSQFSLQYANVSGVGETLYSSSQSIDRGAFEYKLIDAVTLEVNYTVGNVPRTFLIPPAIPESRMLPFLDKMELDDRRKIETSYRLYDIDNLRSNDNRSELLSLYPDLSNEKVYVLRENTQEFMKEQIEEFFDAVGYTREDYLDDASRYPSSSGADRPAFSITFRYSLDGRSLVVNIPFDSIGYSINYPIIRLDVLPFMGAGGLEDEGYLLVPDGSGALIYFNNKKQSQLASINSVYGWDEGMPRDVVVSENRAPYPVFGIQKNGAALLCVIEEGASYAYVQADVSGRNAAYNRVFAYFDMIHGAIMDISGRSDRAVYLYEYGLPQGEQITMRYTVCESDGYVGMAKEYRSQLLRRFPELGRRPAITSLPVAVEVVGAVNKTQHRLGIPFDLPLKLTSYKETEGMINDFVRLGWKNVNVKLTGWFNRSYEHTVPGRINLIGILGSKKDFTNIVSAAEKNNFILYPEADFVYVRDLRMFDGFSLYRDASRYVSRKRVERYPFSFVWFGERIRWGKISYLARPAVTMKMIDSFKKDASSLELNNFAFRNMGARLGGDYNERRHVSREASMIMRQEKLAELSGAGNKILLSTGYVYSAPWANFITDMALDCQGFGITDVSVPFYQIVLHGLVPYTGRAINLAEDYTKNLLKTIEGGAGLYFSFMTEETVELQETKFRQFYANEYGKWIGDADALVRRFTSDFAGLHGQAIDDHVILSPEVTVTVYEDGTRVVVNRSDKPWNYNGRILNADSYIVLRRGE